MNCNLLTSLERARRHMTSCDLSPICGGDGESLFHIFRDCNRIRMIWNCLQIPNSRDFYTNSFWCVWLSNNLCRSQRIGDISWNLTFGVILDSIWHAQNDAVFNGKVANFGSVILRVPYL